YGGSSVAGDVPSDAPSTAVTRLCVCDYFLSCAWTPFAARFGCAFGLTIPARMKDARPVGEGGERFYPQVDAGLLSSWRQGPYWHINTGEAHIPAIGFPVERDRLWRALQGARPPHGDAPNLGQD